MLLNINKRQENEMKNTKTTKKEKQFLLQVSKSCYAEYIAGEWSVSDYVCEHDYNMKEARGLITSLQNKNIIEIDTTQGKCSKGHAMVVVSINPDFIDYNNCTIARAEGEQIK